MPARPNLTVIRCADIDASALFYGLVGLEFGKHRHGTGPEHHAASDGLWTFELYPASAKFPASSSTRVGFTVDSCDAVASRLEGAGFSLEVQPADSPWGRRAVAIDPDGHRVEFTSLIS
jgi:lactoylglutathione lyase